MIKKLKEKTKKFLLWTQKWTKTDMLYLAKGGFWLSGGQIFYMGISFLGTIAFANLLPEETYGTYKYVLSILAILNISTLVSVDTSLIRAVSKGCEGDLIPSVKTKIKWGYLGSLASVTLAFYYLFRGNITLGSIFILASLFIPFLSTFNIYVAYLNGLKKFKEYALFDQSVQTISIGTAILTIFLTQNIFLILLVYFISNTLVRLIFFLITLKKYPPNKKRDSQTISFGKHLSLVNIFSIVSANLDKILIFTFLGASEVAIYTMAIKPVDQIKSIFKHISTLALPKLSQKSWEEIKSTIPEKMNKLMILLIPVAILWVVFAPIAFKYIFPRYTSAVIYSQVYIVTLLLLPRVIIAQSLVAQAAKKQIYTLNIITPISKIILLIALLPFFKIWGAVIALIGSYFVNYIYLKIILRKKITK